MKENYTTKILLLGLLFTFSNVALSQGNCDDLMIPIQGQMGLDVEPADFFVRAGSQTGRIFRDAIPAVCPNKIYPGDFNPGLPYNWTAVRLYNSDTSPLCITINVDVDSGVFPCGTNGHAHVYQSADGLDTEPYDPVNQANNFVGDRGSSVSGPFSVDVAPGWFEIVFSNTSAPDNCDFSFTVDDGGTGLIQCDDATAGISENQLSLIQIYPNPASETINFKMDGIEISSVELIDLSGKLIVSKTELLNNQLNVKGFAPGLYFVKISSDNASITKKLIINP